MKLVLRDYINSLKEDQELDSLLTDLCWSTGYKILTKPKKGKQYGVDIAAIGKKLFGDLQDTVTLFVVKRGDITPHNWDLNKNSPRQSITEIIDAYIPTQLHKEHREKKIKIVLATNGELDQNLNLQWTQFVNAHLQNNSKLEIDFLGTGELVNLIERHITNELLFPEKYRQLLRKTLSFLDLPDYDLRHFRQLVGAVFADCNPQKVNRALVKNLRLINLLSHIMLKYGQEIKNYKPVLLATEYTILAYWNWIIDNDLEKENKIIKEFIQYHNFKLSLNHRYYLEIQQLLDIPHGLYTGSRNHLEYCLITFEQIGIISLIGLTDIDHANFLAQANNSECDVFYNYSIEIAEGLGCLIENNPSSFYPKYDEHCIEVNLAMVLFYKTGMLNFANFWLEQLIIYLENIFKTTTFFPLFIKKYEDLVDFEIDRNYNKNQSKSSHFITILIEWTVVLKNDKLYNRMLKVIKDNFANVDCQMWYPEKDTESKLFISNAMNETGSTRSTISFPKSMVEYEMEMKEESAIFFNEGHMSHNKLGFMYLEFIANRVFRTYVLPNTWRSLFQSRFCFNKNN